MYEKAEDGVPDMQFECDDERYEWAAGYGAGNGE